MTKNEYTLRLAEMILSDWRAALISTEENGARIALPGDTAPISLRAIQQASELADDFYILER